MTATGQNLEMYKGDSKLLVITSTDDSNNPLDLSGCTLNYVIYRTTPSTIVVTKTTTSGIAITDPTGGIFEITLYPADTEGLLGFYQHECELTDLSNNISTLFTGKVQIFDSKA